MQHLQAIEGNPLDAEDIAMFEMFERERWSHERCLAYILEGPQSGSRPASGGMSDDPYVYPGTIVLRNKFGIRDAERFDYVERRLTTSRARKASRPAIST